MGDRLCGGGFLPAPRDRYRLPNNSVGRRGCARGITLGLMFGYLRHSDLRGGTMVSAAHSDYRHGASYYRPDPGSWRRVAWRFAAVARGQLPRPQLRLTRVEHPNRLSLFRKKSIAVLPFESLSEDRSTLTLPMGFQVKS